MSEIFRWQGSLRSLSPADHIALCARSTSTDADVRERTAAIVSRVRADGDAALRALASELDGVALEDLRVPRDVRARALATLDAPVRDALEHAAANIRAVHRTFLPRTAEVEVEPGVVVGRRADPLDSVGVYAPGGRAAYPSSVLMGVVPAKVAGVPRVVLCSPPGRNGLPSQVVLAAGELAGVDEVYAIGGAGAIAAMAYGTSSIAAVRRIVGPGNAYVAEAKLQVAGITGIDSPAGPSELLVIADDSSTPAAVARELLAQAEHDPRAAVVVIALDERVAREIEQSVRAMLAAEPRRAIIAEALATRGALLCEPSLELAIELANEYAPEHLLLAVRNPDEAWTRVRNAGTVFLGSTSSVAFGDYMTGANHVLPTGGLARSYSGLSTLDFVRWTTYQRVTRAGAAALAADVAVLARAEGLPAHAAAAAGADIATEDGETRSRRVVTARATIRELSLYDPKRGPCALDLSDNTNRWGAAPAATRALREADADAITRYPTVYATALKAALADYAGVRASEVVTGCGSDDVLDSTIRAFADPGDLLAYPEPTFGMLPLFARMNGLVAAPVPMPNPHEIDVDALLAARARVTYICSPNNPTGLSVSSEQLEHLIENAAGIVIIDEAYAEFSGARWVERAPSLTRLVVARTMSKAFGLAGLRVGYATGAAPLILAIEKARGPYMIGAAAERAALAALRDDIDWMRENAQSAIVNRARFIDALRALRMQPLDSTANFVFVPVFDAAVVSARMRAAGVAVRPFPAVYGVGDGVRITIGPWPMMEMALAVLRDAVAQ